jgi:hypothetical protein
MDADTNKEWQLTIRADSNDDLWFAGYDGTSWRQPLVLTQAGDVGIGTAAPTQKLTVSGNVLADAYLYTSDRRLKDQIMPLTGMLDKIAMLEPVSFVYTADANRARHLGLIAQDVAKIFPDVVHTDAKGMLSIDYPALIGPMIGAIKELKAENDALKAQNVEILKRLDKLEAALAHQ